MQIFVKQRETISGAITFHTSAIDVSGAAMMVTGVNVYDTGGTSPVISVQQQTGDDLETWTNIGSAISVSSVDQDYQTIKADTTPYGRYTRYQIDLSGTDPVMNYSIVLNTHSSS